MTFVLAIVTAGMSAFAGALLCAWLVASSPAAAFVAASCATFYGASGLALSRVGMAPGFDIWTAIAFKAGRTLVLCAVLYQLVLAFQLELEQAVLPFVAGVLMAGFSEIFLTKTHRCETLKVQPSRV